MNESKTDRFRRVAEARVNKIIKMIRLLGNCSGTGVYEYTDTQAAYIFSALQSELDKAKKRFRKPSLGKHRFSLTDTNEFDDDRPLEPTIALALPDGSYLRAVVYEDDHFPAINIYWDHDGGKASELLCFAEYNSERDEGAQVCIGTYVSKVIKLTWSEVAEMVRTELRKIIGRDVFCVAKSDDDTYWDISFPLERLPLSDLHRILEALDATDSQRDLSLPPEEDHADSVSSLSMTVSQLLLRRNLGYDCECLHLAEDSFWILGVKDAPETNDFIKIGSQRFPLGELKSRQEVLDYLRENGASHTALMDICEEYREKYQNELCWHYPTTDELHLGTFLLLVKEGVLSLPFNEVDSVDYELFCLEDACLCDAASINMLIADWYRFDADLRHAMEGMRRYYEKKEGQNEVQN